jgi:hypothetical protein
MSTAPDNVPSEPHERQFARLISLPYWLSWTFVIIWTVGTYAGVDDPPIMPFLPMLFYFQRQALLAVVRRAR